MVLCITYSQHTLLKVNINDAAKAERMVSLLMGDVVEPRKNYLYTYAEF